MSEVEKIGDTAGKVWSYLNQSGRSSISAVEKGVKASNREVQMAIGWLAREGKVQLEQEGRTLQISLT